MIRRWRRMNAAYSSWFQNTRIQSMFWQFWPICVVFFSPSLHLHHREYFDCTPLYIFILSLIWSLWLSQQNPVCGQTNLINVQNNVTYVNLFYCVMSIRYWLFLHRCHHWITDQAHSPRSKRSEMHSNVQLTCGVWILNFFEIF